MTARGFRPLALAAGVALALSACAGPAEPAAAPPSTTSTAPAPVPAPTPTRAAPAVTSALDPATVPEPTAVAVPALGIEQDLIGLGIAGDGTAEVPVDFDDVGWFTPGGRPGARGPTVLMGHVDSTAGPAVFSELGDLAPGDTVALTVADGSVATYTVTGTEQVAKDSFPTAAVFGATADDVLRLITCTGAFDAGARSYTDNLVVTAVRTG